MENNKYRNTNDIDDTEYRRMRESEDSSYEYHGADAEETDKENADNGYPEVVEHNHVRISLHAAVPGQGHHDRRGQGIKLLFPFQ